MKKSLLGLLIAIVGFLCGVLTVGIFRAEQKTISIPVAEETKVEVVKNNEIPLFRVGQLEEKEKIETNEDIDQQEIYGWYSHPDHKKMPELDGFILSSSKYKDDGTESEKTVSSVMVFTELGKDIDEGIVQSYWAELKGNKLNFKTAKIKGIKYSFEGTFFKNKATGKEGEEVLRGTLQKFVKGKKVAEVSGNFAYYEPHCWH